MALNLTGGRQLSENLSPALSDSKAYDLHTRRSSDDGPETQREYTSPKAPREIAAGPRPETSTLDNDSLLHSEYSRVPQT